MHTKKISIKEIFSWMITLCLLIFSLPQIALAADTSVYIRDISYPTSTLSKGDKFSVSFEFYTTSDTSFKDISISGEAVDSSSSSYEVTDGESIYPDDTKEIGLGTILTATYSNLIYTGTGSEVKVSVSTDAGSASSSFSLKVMTSENMEGALILDSSSTSNLSLSMNAGESKNFSLQIKNATSDTVKNGVAKVYFSSTTTGLSVTSGQYTSLGSLNSNSSRNISFSLSATSAVKAGTYTLIVELNGMKQEVSVSIDSNITPPILELSIDENAKFTLGEVNPITLSIKNTGGKTAKNVKVTIENDSDLAVVGNSNVKTLANLTAGSSTSYSTKIQLDSSTSSNLVLLKLGLTYSDESGESYTDSQTVYLNTDTVKNTNDLSITKITSPSGTYEPDQNFNVSFNISSLYGAENVKVSVKPDTGIIAKSQSVFVLSKLDVGKTQGYTVSFAATDEATTGNHPIEILLEYEYQNKDFSMSQYASVNISNEDDEDDKTSPKVILSECVASPQIVQAGQDVTINFTFLNTHPSKTVYNLTATLDFNTNDTNDDDTTTSATSLFSTVSSSNTLFTSSLTPGQSNSQNIIIGTSASATAASYDVYVDLSYQDEDGNEISSRETIPITISQDVTIDIAQIDLSSLTIGRSSALTATIYNTSKSDISNVMMYLESDALGSGFTVTDNKSYLSAFSMGATEYYAPTLTGVAGGTYDVNLVIEYEDCLGEAQTLRYPFTIEVIDNNATHEMSMDGKGGIKANGGMSNMPQNMQQSSTSPWMIVGIILCIAAVFFIIIKVIRRRKAKKDFNINE